MPQFKLSDDTVIDSICVDNAPKADGHVKRIPLRFTAVDEMASGGQFVDLESQPDTARKITRFIVQPKPGAIGKAAVYGKATEPRLFLAGGDPPCVRIAAILLGTLLPLRARCSDYSTRDCTAITVELFSQHGTRTSHERRPQGESKKSK